MNGKVDNGIDIGSLARLLQIFERREDQRNRVRRQVGVPSRE